MKPVMTQILFLIGIKRLLAATLNASIFCPKDQQFAPWPLKSQFNRMCQDALHNYKVVESIKMRLQ